MASIGTLLWLKDDALLLGVVLTLVFFLIIPKAIFSLAHQDLTPTFANSRGSASSMDFKMHKDRGRYADSCISAEETRY